MIGTCRGDSNSEGSRGASVVSLPSVRAASRSRKSLMTCTAPGRPGGGVGSSRGCRLPPSDRPAPACPPRAACAAPRHAAPATGSARCRTAVASHARTPGSADPVANPPGGQPGPWPAPAPPAARPTTHPHRRWGSRQPSANSARPAVVWPRPRRRSVPAPAGRCYRASGMTRAGHPRTRRVPASRRPLPRPARAADRCRENSPRPLPRIADSSSPRRCPRRTGARAVAAAAHRARPAAASPASRPCHPRNCWRAATDCARWRTVRRHAPRPAAAARAWACACWSPGRHAEARFGRLGHADVALPTLVLELQVLDRHRVGVGVQVRHRLVLGHPAAIQLVGQRELARLVVDLQDQILAEVLQRDLGAEPRPEIPYLVRPLLEGDVMGHAAFDGDRLILGTPGRLARAAGVAALAMLDHFGGALQAGHLADAGHVATVPFQPELEVLVRIETLRIDTELSHDVFLRSGSGRPSAAAG